jgi:hypothetical protein
MDEARYRHAESQFWASASLNPTERYSANLLASPDVPSLCAEQVAAFLGDRVDDAVVRPSILSKGALDRERYYSSP